MRSVGIIVVALGIAVIMGMPACAYEPDYGAIAIAGSFSKEQMASSLMGSLNLIPQAQGVNTDYTDLMGHSGAAFRAALDDRWDFGSMDMYFEFDFLKLTLEAYGWSYVQVPDLGANITEAVKKSIDAGIPALGVVSGVGDFAPIVGYVPSSGEIITREWGTGKTSYLRPTLDNASNVVILTKNGAPRAKTDAVKQGLARAVWLWKEAKEPGCAWGAAAYEKWIAGLRNRARIDELTKDFAIASANRYIFRCFQDARTQAVEYLKRHANDLGPEAAPRFQQAVQQYATARDALKELPPAQNWDAAAREKQAKQLEAALAAERSGIAAIEDALKAAK